MQVHPSRRFLFLPTIITRTTHATNGRRLLFVGLLLSKRYRRASARRKRFLFLLTIITNHTTHATSDSLGIPYIFVCRCPFALPFGQSLSSCPSAPALATRSEIVFPRPFGPRPRHFSGCGFLVLCLAFFPPRLCGPPGQYSHNPADSIRSILVNCESKAGGA